MSGSERFYIHRRDTDIRGPGIMRRIVKVLDGTDEYHTVSFRPERRGDPMWGRIRRMAAADFHKRYVIIVPLTEAERRERLRRTSSREKRG